MLRISIHDESEDSVQLALEGWLVGPWVDELRRQSDQALSGAKSVTLDCGKLWFADPSGITLLHELASRRVAQINCSTFISQQLKETTV